MLVKALDFASGKVHRNSEERGYHLDVGSCVSSEMSMDHQWISDRLLHEGIAPVVLS